MSPEIPGPAFTQPGAATLSQRGEGGSSQFVYEVFRDLLDDKGNPRLSCARQLFLQDLDRERVPVLAEAFRFWRDYAEYLGLKGVNRVTGEKLFVAVKCSKRGNDVFSRRLDQKLGFLSRMEGIQLFSPEDFKPGKVVRSNLLWVTLTYNPALSSLRKAWMTYMEDWNLWITNLRNKYGKIDVLKFSEAFPDESGEAFGYPHIHVVLLFREAQFRVFPRMEEGRDGKLGLVYRIQEKFELENQGKWHSWVDVKALSSGRALGGYLRKHTKNTHYGDDQGALVTQALLWLYRKQTFSMSSGFRQNFIDLIMTMHDSKGCQAQKTLDGQLLDDWIWSFHGVRSALELGVDPGIWVQSLDEEKFHRIFGDVGR